MGASGYALSLGDSGNVDKNKNDETMGVSFSKDYPCFDQHTANVDIGDKGNGNGNEGGRDWVDKEEEEGASRGDGRGGEGGEGGGESDSAKGDIVGMKRKGNCDVMMEKKDNVKRPRAGVKLKLVMMNSEMGNDQNKEQDAEKVLGNDDATSVDDHVNNGDRGSDEIGRHVQDSPSNSASRSVKMTKSDHLVEKRSITVPSSSDQDGTTTNEISYIGAECQKHLGQASPLPDSPEMMASLLRAAKELYVLMQTIKKWKKQHLSQKLISPGQPLCYLNNAIVKMESATQVTAAHITVWLEHLGMKDWLLGTAQDAAESNVQHDSRQKIVQDGLVTNALEQSSRNPISSGKMGNQEHKGSHSKLLKNNDKIEHVGSTESSPRAESMDKDTDMERSVKNDQSASETEKSTGRMKVAIVDASGDDAMATATVDNTPSVEITPITSDDGEEGIHFSGEDTIQENAEVKQLRRDVECMCKVCGKSAPRSFVHCVNCYASFHTYCIDLKGRSGPVSDWKCPSCLKRGARLRRSRTISMETDDRTTLYLSEPPEKRKWLPAKLRYKPEVAETLPTKPYYRNLPQPPKRSRFVNAVLDNGLVVRFRYALFDSHPWYSDGEEEVPEENRTVPGSELPIRDPMPRPHDIAPNSPDSADSKELRQENGGAECEFCAKWHDGSFGSGRFCSSTCARSVGGLSRKRGYRNALHAKPSAHNVVQGLPKRQTTLSEKGKQKTKNPGKGYKFCHKCSSQIANRRFKCISCGAENPSARKPKAPKERVIPKKPASRSKKSMTEVLQAGNVKHAGPGKSEYMHVSPGTFMKIKEEDVMEPIDIGSSSQRFVEAHKERENFLRETKSPNISPASTEPTPETDPDDMPLVVGNV